MGRELHVRSVLTIDEQIELEIRARKELEDLRREAANEEVDPQAVAVDVAIGRLSRLDSMQMEEVRKDATRRRNQRIHELQQALRRMDEGDYGICESCQDWISYARLEQKPEADLILASSRFSHGSRKKGPKGRRAAPKMRAHLR